MKRMKRHKVKKEQPESSSCLPKGQGEHDLAYYIHDRVELMHQVFSCLKYKQLKAMAPECIRHISIDDLQELCTEELLGISSKRLCAILDGAEPPSDTESSSRSASPALETISLDSISSDEEILSETSKSSKKNRKHKHKHSKEKSKKREKRKSKESDAEEETERSKASRAGLTVLELLELQARARAIRAQLQKEQATKQSCESAPLESGHSSGDEVEIKEEPPEVVEISSEDEKPDIHQLETETQKAQETAKISQTNQQSVVKRINDLVITIPQSKQTRKIKLNRTKAPTNPDTGNTKSSEIVPNNDKTNENNKNIEKENTINKESNKSIDNVANNPKEKSVAIPKSTTNIKNKAKKSKNKKKRQKIDIEEDHDEITLQLSDTEKMDLLEDLDRKNLDNVSSSCTEDSECSSDTSDEDSSLESNKRSSSNKEKVTPKNNDTKITKNDEIDKRDESPNNTIPTSNNDTDNSKINVENSKETPISSNNNKIIESQQINTSNLDTPVENINENIDNISEVNRQSVVTGNENKEDNYSEREKQDSNLNKDETQLEARNDNLNSNMEAIENKYRGSVVSNTSMADSNTKDNTDSVEAKDSQNEGSTKEVMDCTSTDIVEKSANTVPNTDTEGKLSDGELTDNESSEIEVTDLKPEVVCISDEEVSKKKKKKKDKKKKKSKKKDFRESSDQNFFKDKKSEKDTDNVATDNTVTEIIKENRDLTTDTMDNDSISSIDNKDLKENNYIIIEDEILILSDDSSCYEVDKYLSKEPTAEEIEALSLKIDEIDRDNIISDKEIQEHEQQLKAKEKSNSNDDQHKATDIGVEEKDNNISKTEVEYVEEENISWKERYLGSKKVKKVLSTANIFNALRKKNIELKKKLEEKRREEELKKLEVDKEKSDQEKQTDKELELGSVEHYNTLEGSTKYVDPVTEMDEKETDDKVTREMKRDAKQLLKMYKKLLKYNDMNKVKDPSKKKKKKKSKEQN